MALCNNVQGSGEKVFPMGMRVLLYLCQDWESLQALGVRLMECGHQVTVAEPGNAALELLRESKGNYDLVISDFHMHEMDGFRLLEFIDAELELPVVLLSTNNDPSHVMNALLHGAADVLLKPVKIEDLNLLWKNACRKFRSSMRNKQSSINEATQNVKIPNEERPNEKRKNLLSDSHGEQQHKRQRISWSMDLHTRFVDAVNQLGIDKATPKRILKIMNVEGLTPSHIGSHLQKYRRSLSGNGTELNQHAFERNADQSSSSQLQNSANDDYIYRTCLMGKDSGFDDSAHSLLPGPSTEGGIGGDPFSDAVHSESRSNPPVETPPEVESALPDLIEEDDSDAILIETKAGQLCDQDSRLEGGVLSPQWIDCCRRADGLTAEQCTNASLGSGVPGTDGSQIDDWQTIEQLRDGSLWMDDRQIMDACLGDGTSAGEGTDGCSGGQRTYGCPGGDGAPVEEWKVDSQSSSSQLQNSANDDYIYRTSLLGKDSGFDDSAHSLLPGPSTEDGTGGDPLKDAVHSESRSNQPVETPPEVESALRDLVVEDDSDAILMETKADQLCDQDSMLDGGLLSVQCVDCCLSADGVTAEQCTNASLDSGVPGTDGSQIDDWQTIEQLRDGSLWMDDWQIMDACLDDGTAAVEGTDACSGWQ